MQRNSHPDGGYAPSALLLRGKRRVIAGGLLLLCTVVSTPGCHRPAPSPSVLLIVVDTLRADRVGALRHPEAVGGPLVSGSAVPASTGATPLLDQWASKAARFRRASTPAPFTMPAMAALFSGSYPDRTGVVAHEPGSSLDPWPGRTLAEAAGRAGLQTAAVVANPWLARAGTGFSRGFGEFSRLYVPGAAPGSSSASAVTDEAIRLLEGIAGGRFLLWVHYFDPHMPYRPPARFAQAAGAAAGPSRVMDDFDAPGRDLRLLYQGAGYSAAEIEQARGLYDGEVRYTDHEIGRLLERMESLGLAANTLVVVASDHGESLGEHGLYFAHDYTLYEELTRVALMMRGPGVPPGPRDDNVSLIDVAPTVCQLAALDCGGGFDGRDLFAPPDRERTLMAASTPLRTKGTPFDRLEVPGLDGRWTMALRGTAKLLRIPSSAGTTFEMYDLAGDPAELDDIAGRAAGEQSRLEAELKQWTQAMESARPGPTPRQGRRQHRRDTKALRSLGYLQ